MSYTPPANGFRTFLVVWISQSVSVFGSALTYFAINIWLTQTLYPRPDQKPQLAFALTALGLAMALPTLVAGPIAGAWADRHDRKRTMLAMDLLSAVLTSLLVLLMATQRLTLPILVVGGVVMTVVAAFHGAAFDTAYAMLVPDHQLPRANGMMQTMWALSSVLSPALAAFLISLPALARQGHVPGGLGPALSRFADGAPLAIAIDAATFLLAGCTLLFLHVPSPIREDLHTEDGRKKSLWADVREGARYIWLRRPLLWLLGTFTLANLVLSPLSVLQPLFVKFNLAPDWSARGYTYETALALVISASSIGGVAGGLFISAWGGLKKRRVYGVLAPMIVVGALLAGVGFSRGIYVVAGLAALATATSPLMNAHSQAIWQTQTPRGLQGRVFSVRRLIAQCSAPFGVAVAGWLGGHFNPGLVIAGMGIILVVFCAAQMLNPYLLRVEDKEYLDGLAVARERQLVEV